MLLLRSGERKNLLETSTSWLWQQTKKVDWLDCSDRGSEIILSVVVRVAAIVNVRDGAESQP
jgi:hypothetical protein